MRCTRQPDRDLRDEPREAARDAVDAHARRMSEARDLRLRVVHEVAAHRAEHARAREEPVDEHDDVVARVDLFRHDGRDVTRHERDLAKRRDGLGQVRAKRPGDVADVTTVEGRDAVVGAQER